MPLLDNPRASVGLPSTVPVLNQVGGGMPDQTWLGLRRPYLDKNGRACVTINDLRGGWTAQDSRGGEKKPLLRGYLVNDLRNLGYPIPTANATSMTIRAWAELDSAVTKAFRQELRAAADLEAASSYGGFDAMARMTLERQVMSDAGEAFVDMDGTIDGRNDQPLVDLESLPLPITHSDFGFTQRLINVSRSGNMPLDTVMGEQAARKVAESIEDQVIGNVTGITYGTQSSGYGTHRAASRVWGYTNFTYRLTKTNFTAPSAGGWTPDTTFQEVLAALQQLLNQRARGPFILYHSRDWFQYVNRNFAVSGGNNAGETLLSMLKKIPSIQDVRLLERLTSTFTLLFVQMTAEVAQMVNGMDVSTVQWEEKGGLEQRFKVMAIKVPRLSADYSQQTGILHGTTA